MKILLDVPLNSLSLGNVSFNLVRECFNRELEIGIFPVQQPDLSAYQITPELEKYIQHSINNRYAFLDDDIPALRVWHLNGAENKKNARQILYTFYECSAPTPIERCLANHQDEVAFSSFYASEQFENGKFIPLGFDPDFFVTGEKYLKDVVHFGLMGKFENRKHTARIIKLWAKKYGNDPKYQLTCCVNNPFMKPEQLNAMIHHTLEGKNYSNINFLQFLKKNSEVNDFLNSIDIDLTGLSGGEGWNLPSFNATCLGKWSVVLNETSHKDWATEDNSILVESSSVMPVDDNLFFKTGTPFNQGVFFCWDEDAVASALDKAVQKVGQVNAVGQRLADTMTYANTMNSLLSLCFKENEVGTVSDKVVV